MPFELWVAASALLFGSFLMRWLIYRRALRCSLAQAVGATLAFAALHHSIVTASIAAALRRPGRWVRTSKFPSSTHTRQALRSCRLEIALGGAALGVGIGLSAGSDGIVAALGVGTIFIAFLYLCAPLIAVVAAMSGPRAPRRVTVSDSATTEHWHPDIGLHSPFPSADLSP
jgi:hypothetical protein